MHSLMDQLGAKAAAVSIGANRIEKQAGKFDFLKSLFSRGSGMSRVTMPPFSSAAAGVGDDVARRAAAMPKPSVPRPAVTPPPTSPAMPGRSMGSRFGDHLRGAAMLGGGAAAVGAGKQVHDSLTMDPNQLKPIRESMYQREAANLGDQSASAMPYWQNMLSSPVQTMRATFGDVPDTGTIESRQALGGGSGTTSMEDPRFENGQLNFPEGKQQVPAQEFAIHRQPSWAQRAALLGQQAAEQKRKSRLQEAYDALREDVDGSTLAGTQAAEQRLRSSVPGLQSAPDTQELPSQFQDLLRGQNQQPPGYPPPMDLPTGEQHSVMPADLPPGEGPISPHRPPQNPRRYLPNRPPQTSPGASRFVGGNGNMELQNALDLFRG